MGAAHTHPATLRGGHLSNSAGRVLSFLAELMAGWSCPDLWVLELRHPGVGRLVKGDLQKQTAPSGANPSSGGDGARMLFYPAQVS